VGAWAKSIVFDHSGAAYVFDAATGLQVTRLVPSDGADRDNFGISISVDNGVVAVGAHQDDDNGFNSGSAYLFDAISGGPLEKLLASDGAVFDLHGSSVAIDAGVASVGAIGDDDNGADSGSAYVFYVSAPLPGDFDDDGDVDQADFVQFEACFTGADAGPIAPACEPGDFDGDGDIDCLDFNWFAQAWTEPGSPPVMVACVAAVPAVSRPGIVIMILVMLSMGVFGVVGRERVWGRG